MPQADLRIVRIGDAPPWEDLDRNEVIHLQVDTWRVAVLEHGMQSGLPSVALRLDLPDGKSVIAETSLQMLIAVLAGAHGAFPQAFAGGFFDVDALRAEITRLQGETFPPGGVDG